jgi:hypothetical protein
MIMAILLYLTPNLHLGIPRLPMTAEPLLMTNGKQKILGITVEQCWRIDIQTEMCLGGIGGRAIGTHDVAITQRKDGVNVTDGVAIVEKIPTIQLTNGPGNPGRRGKPQIGILKHRATKTVLGVVIPTSMGKAGKRGILTTGKKETGEQMTAISISVYLFIFSPFFVPS